MDEISASIKIIVDEINTDWFVLNRPSSKHITANTDYTISGNKMTIQAGKARRVFFFHFDVSVWAANLKKQRGNTKRGFDTLTEFQMDDSKSNRCKR